MDDIDWLKKLHDDLWPKDREKEWRGVVSREAITVLTHEEWDRVVQAIETHQLVASMFSANMFGGYGMSLLEHETFPGTGAQHLVNLVEGHLPGATRYDHMLGEAEPRPKKKSGSGRDDAWEAFSKFTHSDQNRVWLKQYGLDEPRERYHYDY